MKELAFKYKVPIYDLYVIFVITQDIRLAHDKFQVTFLPDECATHGGEAHATDGIHYMFLNPGCLTHAYIAHELLHITHGLCEDIGIMPEYGNDEAESHLFYNLIEFFYNKAKSLGLLVSNKISPEPTKPKPRNINKKIT